MLPRSRSSSALSARLYVQLIHTNQHQDYHSASSQEQIKQKYWFSAFETKPMCAALGKDQLTQHAVICTFTIIPYFVTGLASLSSTVSDSKCNFSRFEAPREVFKKANFSSMRLIFLLLNGIYLPPLDEPLENSFFFSP